MEDPRPVQGSKNRSPCPSTPLGASISPTATTTACGKSTPTAPSGRWPAPGETGPRRIDGPAAKAPLGLPVGVAAGPAGSVYIADEPANRVYKINADGLMTTFAGTGKAGYSGSTR